MNFVAHYLAQQTRSWEHDRSATIGASEIGQCARRVWFVKNGAAADATYEESRGAAARGDLIEREIWLPALRLWAAENRATIHCAGEQQQTLTDGYLSVTPDAIVVMPDGEVVLRECKSIDPRVMLDGPKPQHRDQVQTQLGVVAASGKWSPVRAIIDYVDASFLDRVTSFEITADPSVYQAAKARALTIMDAVRPIDLRPEGKMTGGKECDNCAFASRCAHEQASSVPSKADVPLAGNAIAALAEAVARCDDASGAEKRAKADKSLAQEEIKEILRAHGARRVDAETFSVSWASVKGRHSVDLKALEASGIDLTPFHREGDPSERLTIKSKETTE